MNIGHYAKALLYIALAVVGVLVTALADELLSVDELVNVAIIGVGAITVYLVPNLPSGPGAILKTLVAFAVAGLVALQSFLTGGVSTTEWLQVAVAAFAGVGVYVIPNEPPVVMGRGADGVWRA
ncbi:MAG: hypothetical protein K0S49_61 [Microbacterium sp.]|jgi:hypothetical protein|nr:hypothetical protein [Microbacterium sp.]